MATRKAISKSTRFEVFKRDKFTCQYCGKAAPEVVLHVDHIDPVSKGGSNDIMNLITACIDCNLGKSARVLSDDSAVQKKKAQMDELQERREQLEMMVEWQKGLLNITDNLIDEAANMWADLVKGFCLNEVGLLELRRIIRIYGFSEVVESMRRSTENYLRFECGSSKIIPESAEKAWEYVEKIARSRKRIAERPSLADAYKLIASLKYKVNLGYPGKEADRIADCLEKGLSTEFFRKMIVGIDSWQEWEQAMTEVEHGLDAH